MQKNLIPVQQTSLIIGIGVIAALAIIVVVATQRGQQETQKAPPPQSTTQTAESQKTVKEIIVEGDEYKYTPETITLQAGEKTKITFKNVGKIPHNLSVDEINLTTATIPGGKETSVEITPTESGEYAFYCSVGNHRALGMEGNLSVK